MGEYEHNTLTHLNRFYLPEGLSDQEKRMRKRELICEYATARPFRTRKQLEELYTNPQNEWDGGYFFAHVETGLAVFDRNGREVERLWYPQSSGKPRLFDISKVLFRSYSENGYVVEEVVMEVGKIGYRRWIDYIVHHDFPWQVRQVTTQEFLRTPDMQIGPDVGQPIVIDFSDMHYNQDT